MTAKPATEDSATLRYTAGAFRGAGDLIAALLAQSPGLSALALALLLAAAVTEAFGLALIVPLLYVTGLADAFGNRPPIVDAVAGAVDRIGLELTLPSVLVIFLGLAIVRVAAAWQRQQVLARLAHGFEDRLRGDLYAATASAKWSHLTHWRRSDIHNALTREIRRAGGGVNLLFQLTVGAVLALAQFAVAIAIDPLVSLGAVLAGAALALLTVPLASRSARRGTQLTRRNEAVHALVSDFLAGLRLVKSHNAEARHLGDFTVALLAARKSELAGGVTLAAARAVMDLGAACTLAVLAYAAITFSGLALPELLVLVLVFARLLPSFSRLQQLVQQLVQQLPAYVHARGMIDRLCKGAEPVVENSRPPMRLRYALKVSGVTFAYPASPETPVLSDVNLCIPAGRFIVVMGPSGAGKSTLADLLCGLLAPCSGEIMIDGAALTAANARRWRDSVAYVSQDPFMFHESIRANMLRANPKASAAELQRSLYLADAGRIVDALPGGLDTIVGQRGTRLSSGERQRIAIAQALLRNPALLLLDEATANLDAVSERRVAKALVSLCPRVTVVAMTHRSQPAKHADNIILLRSGRVAAMGRWSELEPAIESNERNSGHCVETENVRPRVTGVAGAVD